MGSIRSDAACNRNQYVPDHGHLCELWSVYDQHLIYTNRVALTFCWVLFKTMEAMTSEMEWEYQSNDDRIDGVAERPLNFC
jgi:hypothetical protein